MTNELIEEYSSFVYGISKNFAGYPSRDDLIQAGFLGLIKAKLNYKIEENTKFTTYAYPYILGEMCKLVREDKNIRISRDLIRLKTAIEKATNLLSQKYNRKPTNKEIAFFLELPESEIEKALKTVNMTQSIDETINDDGKEVNLYDLIPSKQLDIDTLISLKEALNELDQKDREMLMYSMNMTQSEIGNMMDMNQVQVSRTLTKIKTKIKNKVA